MTSIQQIKYIISAVIINRAFNKGKLFMFKSMIERHLNIIRTEVHSNPKLLESLNFIIENLTSLNSVIKIKNDIDELGTASKAVYFMQFKNRIKDEDLNSLILDPKYPEIITSITEYEAEHS